MAIIAVAGRKGGVGKSTIVGNLAGELSDMGRRVAVLDADPQHSLAAWAAQGEGMLSRCVEKVKGADGETLRAKARAAEKTADVVLIDTPPGMPEITYQAALVADLFLLPCGPSPLDLFSLKEALSLALIEERAVSRARHRRDARHRRRHRAGARQRGLARHARGALARGARRSRASGSCLPRCC